VIVVAASLAGIYLSYQLFARGSGVLRRLVSWPPMRRLGGLALAGWGFDRLYEMALVRPFLWAARTSKDDVIDSGFSTVAWTARQLSALLSRTQTGRLRYYVAVAAGGVLVFVALGVFR
jgi:NADH-quinone oxidoreductase subunit L